MARETVVVALQKKVEKVVAALQKKVQKVVAADQKERDQTDTRRERDRVQRDHAVTRDLEALAETTSALDARLTEVQTSPCRRSPTPLQATACRVSTT